jgi:hypothetical protein
MYEMYFIMYGLCFLYSGVRVGMKNEERESRGRRRVLVKAVNKSQYARQKGCSGPSRYASARH